MTGTTDTELAKRHLIQPWQEMETLRDKARPVLARGDGIYVTDDTGRQILDGPAGMWCTQVGHGCREIADAIAAQAMELSYNSPWYTTSGPAARLSKEIADRTPGDLNQIFFTTGGSTAVDSALRFTQFYNNVLGRPDKKLIIARHNGYHGSTQLAATISGSPENRVNFDMDLDKVSFLASPHTYRRPEGMTEDGYCDFLVEEFEQRIVELGADRIAAFIAEPVQCSGGLLVAPGDYLPRMLELCRKHDIIYISDEVVTGFGRCGEWFASEDVFGIVPDIITFAKGVTSGYVPLGGMAVSDRLLDAISAENANGSVYSNGYTYSGHPVSCAAGLANIEYFEQHQLLGHVRSTAPYLQEQLQDLRALPLVGDVRGIGMLAAVECVADRSAHAQPSTQFDTDIAKRVDNYCFDLGLLVRPIGNCCVLSPPLVMTRTQIDEMIAILREAIERTEQDLRNEGVWAA